MHIATLSLFVLATLASAKETTRSKRQLGVYYVCGSAPNTYVSQYPCANTVSNCGYSNCNTGYINTNVMNTNSIIPSAFYNSNNFCNTGCNNLNCNQYSGQFINGQYVAYTYGTNQYSPCASSCCNGASRTVYSTNANGYNVVSVSNGFYNPYNNNNNMGVFNPIVSPLANNPIYNPYAVNGNNQGPTCGGTESPVSACNNGYCSNGLHCVSGNICCTCQIGANGGRCTQNTDCGAGYTCTQNGYCCAQMGYTGFTLNQCNEDGSCPANYKCGPGKLCYPLGKL